MSQRVFGGVDLPHSSEADRARYARFRAAAAAADALRLAAAGHAQRPVLDALAAAADALAETETKALTGEDAEEAFAWAPIAIGGHRESEHAATWPRNEVAAALRASGLSGLPPSRAPPARPLRAGGVSKDHASGAAVARGLVPPQRCAELIEALRHADELRGGGGISVVDGQPRCQLTLCRQRAWCAASYNAGGPFASFEGVHMRARARARVRAQPRPHGRRAERLRADVRSRVLGLGRRERARMRLPVVGHAAHWPACGSTIAAALADARVAAAEAFGEDLSELPLWGAFVRRYAPGDRASLAPHTDRCCLTVNVLLSDPSDFDGGGCYLMNRDAGALHCPQLSRGDALLHMGDAEHGEHAVTAGERYVLGLHLGHDALR